jgi:hypothetical protein
LTKIKKDAILSRHATARSALESILHLEPVPRDARKESDTITPATASAKVYARASSSKVLAKTITVIIQGLREALGDDTPQKAKHENQTHEKNHPDGINHVRCTLKRHISEQDSDHEDDGQDSASHTEASGSGNEEHRSANVIHTSADADDDDDDDDGWDSESFHGVDDDTIVDDTSSHRVNNLELKSKQSYISKPILEHQVNTSKETSQSKLLKIQASSSTFLPTLQSGFTRGDGSESDWDDEVSKSIDQPTKKNRRGQRARQA